MGKKHFTEEQIAFALRQAEAGTSVAEVIRKLGISVQTSYRWKKLFAGLGIAIGTARGVHRMPIVKFPCASLSPLVRPPWHPYVRRFA
jgi:predicted DNA-binding transcriptional regulator YafY